MKKFNVTVTLSLNAEDEDTVDSIHQGVSQMIEAAIVNSDTYPRTRFEVRVDSPPKLYRVKLLDGHSAKEYQNVGGYLGYGDEGRIIEYTRGDAIKKAAMFGGKIEEVTNG